MENEDELKLLKLIFNDHPESLLKRFKPSDINDAGLTDEWKKKFIKESLKSKDLDEDSTYSTYKVWEAIEEEFENMKVLEDASNV